MTFIQVKDGNDTARAIFDRHYSRRHYKDGRTPKLFVGPGQKMVLITRSADVLFVWRRFIERGQTEPLGVNCAVFRNESSILSSDLIKEAVTLALARWPGQRLYTYVNPRKIRSCNPGCCFVKAGWRRAPQNTKGGLAILEFQPGGGPLIE